MPNSDGTDGTDFSEFHKMQRARRANLPGKSKNTGSKYSSNRGDSEKREVPAFVLRMKYWKPDSMPTRIRVVPHSKHGLWYSYHARMVQTPKGWRNVISNNWNGRREVPCILDYYAVEEQDDKFRANEYHACTIVVLENFYKIPRVGKNDREYFVYERTAAPDRYGRVNHPDGYDDYEIVFGRQFHWSLSNTQHRNFAEKLNEIQGNCWNCKEGSAESYAFNCPKCEQILADKREEPLSSEDERLLRTDKIECPECKAEINAVEVFECAKQEGYGSSAQWVEGCGNLLSVDFANTAVELVIKSIPAGGNFTAIEIVDFNVAEERKLADWMLEAFDFDAFFGKQDLDDQCQALDKPFPNEFEEKFNGRALFEEYFSSNPNEEDEDSIPF